MKLENAVPHDRKQSRGKARATREMVSTFLFMKMVLRMKLKKKATWL